MANEQYIDQLKETLTTSVPSRIAAFFGEPIQVLQQIELELWMLLVCLLLICCFSTLNIAITLNVFGIYSMLHMYCLKIPNSKLDLEHIQFSCLLFSPG